MSSSATPTSAAPQATPAASSPPNGTVVQAGAQPTPPAAAPAPETAAPARTSVFDAPPVPEETVADTFGSTAKPDLRTEAHIPLNFPIDIGGVKTNRLTMRRPRLGDRLAVLHQNPNEPNVMLEVRFIANLCGVLPQDIEGMDISDYERARDQLNSFTSSVPPTTSKTP